jgi:hypothetical protein
MRNLAVLALAGALASACGQQSGPIGYQSFSADPDAATWAVLESRPLQLPTLTSGQPCPRASGATVSPKVGPALGPGPIYPVGASTGGILQFGGTPTGWYFAKVLWVASPGYIDRHALIRGHQIDGPNELRFEDGVDPPSELHFDGADLGDGWRHQPSYARISVPGCYAFQIDGLGMTEVIAFEAVLE